MPASNPKLLTKIPSLNADAIIVDLEDAVAKSEKQQARDNLLAVNLKQDCGYREIVVRVNQLDSPYIADDLAMLSAIDVDSVLLPMVDTADDIIEFKRLLDEHSVDSSIQIWAMIETPLSVLNCQAIAAVSQQIHNFNCIVIGPNDLSKLTGASQQAGRLPMLSWVSHCILAASAYGIDFMDGVYADIHNHDGLRDECQQGSELGAIGKTLIHPSHLAICNEAFSPSEVEVTYAKRVVKGYENNVSGAVQIDGKMIESLHVGMAKQLLEFDSHIHSRTLS